MKQEEAIRIIAEYDKGVEFDDNGYVRSPETFGSSYTPASLSRHPLPYHTSADALLPVWRKLGKTKLMTNDKRSLQTSYVVVGDCILDGDYPSACLKLAEIINSLKEQK